MKCCRKKRKKTQDKTTRCVLKLSARVNNHYDLIRIIISTYRRVGNCPEAEDGHLNSY